jgi:hypothetical protein
MNVKIDVQKLNGVFPTMFNVDRTIMEGLYMTSDQVKVKNNIKRFKITKRPAKSFNDIGIQYTKNGDCVIVTFNIRQPNISVYGQFVVGSDLDKMDVLNCEDESLEGLHAIIMDACDLSRVNTMQDFLDLERLVDGEQV